MIYKVQCRIMFLFGWLVVITGCFQGVRAGATPRTVVYIHVETHRSGKLSVNHKSNRHIYMHKYCATCLKNRQLLVYENKRLDKKCKIEYNYPITRII